ncbi:glycosyltransferase [Rathayibacter sp. CAU 1779]
MSSAPERRVFAVMSVFHPDETVLENVARTVRQVDAVIVVDDGSGPEYRETLDAVEGAGATVVALEENSGIAAALNAGIRASSLAEQDLLITLDQDSRLPDAFVDQLKATLDRAVAAGLPAGIVAPATFAGVDQTGRDLGSGFVEALRPIQSGMLVTASALKTIGLFDEELFIDLVDVEYYLRALKHGLASVAAVGVDLPHELGQIQSMRMLGRTVSTTLSTPFRYYYRARNRVVITRRYLDLDPALLRNERNRDLAHFGVAMAFARPRGAFVRVLWVGWRDGRGGRLGRISQSTMSRVRAVRWRGERVARS